MEVKKRYKGLESKAVMREFLSGIMKRAVQDKKTGNKSDKRDATIFFSSEYCEFMCEVLGIDYCNMLNSLKIKADIQSIREHERKVRIQLQRLTRRKT